MDLDEIELKATRKLLGLDKKENKQQNYDDNDYLIAREECIEYKKVTDTNVGDIEEAIKIVKSLIENTKESLISNTKLSQNRKTNRIIAYKATEYLLSEYTRQKQINKELKQKIVDKIQERKFELQQEYKDFEDDEILQVLQELLQEEDK